MAHTFFEGRSALYQDRISLTRFAGPGEPGQDRRCLQISTVRFKESCDTPIESRETPTLPGWSYVCLNRAEVLKLRDQLTRFLEGDVSDYSPEETF